MFDREPKSVGLAAIAVIALLAICAILAVGDIRRIHRHDVHGHADTGDFFHFCAAADAMRHHQDPYAAGTRGYIYPPLLAFAFEPLSLLSIDQAAAVMLAVNIGVTLLAVFTAAREYLKRFQISATIFSVSAVALLALLMNIDKVKGEWQMWQTDVFMLLLFVLALRWLDRRPLLAGLVLGIGVNIKYLPLLLLPYLLIRRRWMVAGSLIASTLLFAVLPAIQTGWSANAQNWITDLDGLRSMAGIHTNATEAAEIHDITDALSCSITSALARATHGSGSTALGFALAAITAIAALAITAIIYRRFGLRLLSPDLGPAVTGAEWAVLLAAILAFSPQTNTRHLFDALLLTALASVLLLFRDDSPPHGGAEVLRRPASSPDQMRGDGVPLPRREKPLHKKVNRYPALAGALILIAGFSLPPGSRTNAAEHHAALMWLKMGGPCWCLLVGSLAILWTALSAATSPVATPGTPQSAHSE
jgi:Glycosyltransferase family 87